MSAMAKSKKHTGGAPSQRQLRVGELIRRTLSETLLRGELHDPDVARMSITVSEVRVSPDLRVATVYALPLGGGNKDDAIKGLARNKGELRRAISKSTLLQFTPELRFMADETFDRMDETRRLLADETVQRDINAPIDPPTEEE
jgi:ribosome-binding factor A